MGLEIEFDYDDTQGGVWSPAREAPPLHERVGRRWNAGLSTGNPLFVQAGIALAALALGAASTAGFLEGRSAARDRAIVRLHLAPIDPFVIEPLAPAPSDVRQLLATPWTNTFDQHVTLNVINDSPDSVALLGAQITAPQFGTATLTPVSSGAPTAPGAVTALRGVAHFVCGDLPSVDPVATVARLTLRTADGHTRVQSLMVDRFSDVEEVTVCAAMPGPQVVTATKASTLPMLFPGDYLYDVDVTNRAPFPLLAAIPLNLRASWMSGAGLDVQLSNPLPVTVPARGSARIELFVSVQNCNVAREAVQAGYAYDALAFTDARDGPSNPQARESDQSLALYDPAVINQYCGLPELPGISGGGNGHLK
ncbi:MAG TPA: hypothetical protein VFA06_15465 [Actinocrinis sp.]|uniref:hypothetical protein n=1 Tax=Actinocrinis sp. TaxID=1920516 RepID=UPI002D5F1B82|nr:hypothetical protein [Actinocrinis sp.]HZU57269.1 hypothetical protein [Actinocrinis sp.]